METILGILDKDTPHEVSYVQDEDGSIYERRPNMPERFFCSQKLWPTTFTCAALAAQHQHIDILTYIQQRSLQQNNDMIYKDKRSKREE